MYYLLSSRLSLYLRKNVVRSLSSRKSSSSRGETMRRLRGAPIARAPSPTSLRQRASRATVVKSPRSPVHNLAANRSVLLITASTGFASSVHAPPAIVPSSSSSSSPPPSFRIHRIGPARRGARCRKRVLAPTSCCCCCCYC